jgi:hypothetical protein
MINPVSLTLIRWSGASGALDAPLIELPPGQGGSVVL